MRLAFFVFSSAVFVASSALGSVPFKGHMIGNGGDVVYCVDDGIETAELLDFYEAREVTARLEPVTGDGSSYEEKLSFVLERLRAASPRRATRYAERAATFMDETAWVEDGPELENIDDSEHVALRRGCRIRQIAIHREPEISGDKRYRVDARMWRLLSEVDRAGLILHEIVYREALAYEHVNSVGVRYLTALIASDVLSTSRPQEFASFLAESEFVHFEAYGLVFDLFEMNGFCGSTSGYRLDTPSMHLEFFADGRLAKGDLVCGETVQVAAFEPADLVAGTDIRRTVRFHPSGAVAGLLLERPVVARVGEAAISCVGYEVALHASGKLAGCEVALPVTLPTEDGRLLDCAANASGQGRGDYVGGAYLSFTEAGSVTDWEVTGRVRCRPR